MNKETIKTVLPQAILMALAGAIIVYFTIFIMVLFDGITIGIMRYLPFFGNRYSPTIQIITTLIDAAMLGGLGFKLFKSKTADFYKALFLGFLIIYFYFTLVSPLAFLIDSRTGVAIVGTGALVVILGGLLYYFKTHKLRWHYYFATIAMMLLALSSFISRTGIFYNQ